MFPNDEIPPTVHSVILNDNDFFQLRKERIQITPHDTYDYYTLETPPFSVMVVATTPNNQFILNWEYRQPIRRFLLSCPGGIVHAGEPPLTCAPRELIEETGYTAERFEILGEAYPFPGICTQKTIFVRAHNAHLTGSQQLEPAERLETILFHPHQLREAISSNTPLDSLLLSALFLAGFTLQ